MDVSTELVRAYLHVNGYFSATEYPLVESRSESSPRTVTDIDVLAVRFASADEPDGRRRVTGPLAEAVDLKLACPMSRTDMVVAEVKQGRAQINPATRRPDTLAAALARFGCCGQKEAHALVKKLQTRGQARTSSGHSVRMVLFASRGERAPRGWHWVHLEHVFLFLDRYLRTHKDLLEHVELQDPALSWLSLLHKCGLKIVPEDTCD